MNLPNSVVIAGKGPSLDNVDWGNLPAFRIGVNEACLVVPGCMVAIALDNQVWDVITQHANKSIQFWSSPSVKVKWPNVWNWECSVHTQSADETTACAVRICGYFGVKEIFFVGCDAVDYTDKEHQREGVPYTNKITQLRRNGRIHYNYKIIVRRILQAVKDTKIEAHWLHREVQHVSSSSRSS